jgi:hypothetical protein
MAQIERWDAALWFYSKASLEFTIDSNIRAIRYQYSDYDYNVYRKLTLPVKTLRRSWFLLMHILRKCPTKNVNHTHLLNNGWLRQLERITK